MISNSTSRNSWKLNEINDNNKHIIPNLKFIIEIRNNWNNWNIIWNNNVKNNNCWNIYYYYEVSRIYSIDFH